MKFNFKNSLLYSALIFLALISIVLRLEALYQTSYANGWDGYYYVMQIHSWVKYGYLQSLDFSIIYPYFRFINYFIADYVESIKVGSAVLAGLFTFSCALFTLKTTRNIYLAVLIGVFTVFSPSLTFFVSQFPKNLLGIILFIFFLQSLSNKKYFLIVLFSILCLFSHRLIAGFTLITLLFYSLSSVPKKYIIYGAIMVFIVSLIPGILHFSDLERFSGAFQIFPQFTPLSIVSLFKAEFTYLWIIEILLTTFIGIYIVLKFAKDSLKGDFKREQLVFVVIIFLTFFPFFTINNGSLGYRFYLSGALLFPIFFVGLMKKMPSLILTIVSILLFISSFFSSKFYNPVVHDAPNQLYEKITEQVNKECDTEEVKLIIAPKSLAEMIIFKTDFDALNWNPPTDIDEKYIKRIVANIPYYYFRKYQDAFDNKNLINLDYSFYLIDEEDWQNLIKKAYEIEDKEFLKLVSKTGNPIKPKPDYLKKMKE